MRTWRICRSPYSAFTGEGARRFGGRWNSRGVPMVYSSSSLALAAIELFVHLEPGQAPGDLVCIAAELQEGESARTIEPAILLPNWWTDKGLAVTRDLGDAWIAARSSLAMKVPSVPIRAEWNILINPLHPRITELQIKSPQPFIFDARMFQQTKL
jgi:RES domain-containing protein